MTTIGTFPITGYVGANGAGKTLCMVDELAAPAVAQGLPVLSNFRINHELWVPLRSWRQLVEITDAVVLLDEISAVLPSRQSMSLPPQLVRVLNQLRKRNVVMGWTAPAWARCDLVLRECTQAVAVCRGYAVDRYEREPGHHSFPSSGRIVRGADGRRLPVQGGWGSNRMFRWEWFDARDFDEFSYGTVENVKPARSRWYWRPGHDAHRLYDTREGVDLLDHLDDQGACITCGGARTRKKCNCALESPIQAREPEHAPTLV